jgi:hypothetical protein
LCVFFFQKPPASGHASESEEDDNIPGRPGADRDELPQGSDKTTESLDSVLKDINPRYSAYSWIMT